MISHAASRKTLNLTIPRLKLILLNSALTCHLQSHNATSHPCTLGDLSNMTLCAQTHMPILACVSSEGRIHTVAGTSERAKKREYTPETPSQLRRRLARQVSMRMRRAMSSWSSSSDSGARVNGSVADDSRCRTAVDLTTQPAHQSPHTLGDLSCLGAGS